ncbi:MAG TPA: hypothetical protein VLH94_00755 [Spirochaetia bacterium]|nr:hypothetical protein [Spirochaetia bacterium]
MINDTHRYLLQKYFNNETSFSIQTVGAQDLTLTGALLVGATSATLSSAWTYYTTQIQVTFSNGDIRMCQVVNGGTTLTWNVGLSAGATADITVGGLQYYPLPPNYSKLKTLTITVGNLKWTPTEILTRAEWDKLNVFPYYSDIPNNFFMYPGGDHGAQVGIWPIPSTTGNIITFNYKFRVPDLSLDDYTTPGTITLAHGATTLVGTLTTFVATTNIQNESRWIQFAQPKGDNLWYQLVSVSSTTAATLYQPYQGITVTDAAASTYTIGQMPLLDEAYHDLLVYRPLMIYFSSINPDATKAKEFADLYNTGISLLDQYCGTKTVNVNLGRRAQGMNPNLFTQSLS